jgi:hypothetical protein
VQPTLQSSHKYDLILPIIEVLTAVLLRIQVLWVATPCRWEKKKANYPSKGLQPLTLQHSVTSQKTRVLDIRPVSLSGFAVGKDMKLVF